MSFTTLVDPADLAVHLDDPLWVVFDCRHLLADPESGRRDYMVSHIPGARYANLDEDLASPKKPDTGRHPLPDIAVFSQKLGAWGVDDTKQVVAYDASGGSTAARLWWMLRWLGHRDVALLNGGFQRWVREGHPVTSEVPAPVATVFHARVDASQLVDAAEVERARLDPARRVIDARARERFTGAVEPIDAVAGHIPGAVNAPWEGNLDASGNFLAPEALRARFAATLDGVPADQAVLSCGSGVTACHNLVAMEHAGLGGARLYAGSWSDWITDSRRAVTRG